MAQRVPVTRQCPHTPARPHPAPPAPQELTWRFPQAETPGCIHEGGELGYALAAAYGSVMDRPEQISVVVVGDGESETGPTATAWQ